MTRRRRVMAALVGGGALGALALAASPGFDFTSMPPSHDVAEATLRGHAMTLAEAIALAESEKGGVAREAAFVTRDTAYDTISVVVLHDAGQATEFVIDASTGDVDERAPVPWLPGLSITGEPTTTATGVMWWDVREGDGEMPSEDDANLEMWYEGYLLDGTVFERTEDYGGTLTQPLSMLLPGWAEGMRSMKVGGVRKIAIPPSMAFGAFGRPPQIPPNAMLVFDVELKDIKDFTTLPDELPGLAFDGAYVTTESGLRYGDIELGEGEPVIDLDVIADVHYTMYFTDGEAHMSSRGPGSTGQPARVNLKRLIIGWGSGMSGMRPGGVRKLIIPFELGYGEGGSRGVPPKATLIMDVELVNVIDQDRS